MSLNTFVRTVSACLALTIALSAHAQDPKNPYPQMAPLEQYLMDPAAEIALARSAAPASISADAEIMVLGRHGYQTAVKGKNGFVCIVDRAWAKPVDDSDFWNSKMRGPTCYNATAARFNIPLTLKRTQSILSTQSKSEMVKTINTAFDKKEIPPLQAGAMCYMMSKQGYLGDRDGHWHPHLMFFVPLADAADWGAGQPGAPIFQFDDTLARYTLFFVPVAKWSDGTEDQAHAH